jgi:hypothetical protein
MQPTGSDVAPPLEITECFRTKERVKETFALFKEADMIILQGKDTGECSIAFGVSAMEEIIATGKSQSLLIVRLKIRFNTTDELEIALAAVQHVKGYHDYKDKVELEEIKRLEELFRLDPDDPRLNGIGLEGNRK